ncbi:MAG TPA: RraA family protein [Lacipirellulaceae bacterium]|nr:RraA family protein [Lacipirellulaceae bacterium]
MSLTRKLLMQLAEFDTPTVCNVIDLFAVRPRTEGYVSRDVGAAFPDLPPVVGVACTATFVSSSPSSSDDPYGCVEDLFHAIEARELPVIVACQDLDWPPRAATFGDVMCSIYQQLGAAALMTTGAGRDLAQIRALRFPVFMHSRIAAHAYCRASQVGVPIALGGLQVHPDDLIHADGNGITQVPASIAADLPEAAGEYLKCEAIVSSAIASGAATAADLAAARREMIDGISRLKGRVSRKGSSA